MPSTATTSSADARKIFAVRPNGGAGAAAGARAGLVALEPGIRRVVVPVLVTVGLPLVAARVQGNLEVGLRDAGGHVFHDLAGDALVPHVQPISPGGHVLDREATVARGLGVIAVRHHPNVRHHARMHVAVDADETGMLERVALRLAAAVQPEVEAVGLADGEDVVVEWIVIGKAHRRADGDDHHVRRVLLVGDGDFHGSRVCRRRHRGGRFEIEHRVAQVRRGLVVLFENHDLAGHATGGGHGREGKHGNDSHEQAHRTSAKLLRPRAWSLLYCYPTRQEWAVIRVLLFLGDPQGPLAVAISLVRTSATNALATPMNTAMRVTTRTRGLAVKSPRLASATADMMPEV